MRDDPAFNEDYAQLPGLYRLWDLQLVIGDQGDFQIEYAELTADGTPLFSIWRRCVEVCP